MKKVVVAPDSFKGTISSVEVCEIIEKAFKNLSPHTVIKKIPVADGGEGTVDAFLTALGGKKVFTKVKGPLFDETDSFYGILSDNNTAVIEMAAASGLPLAGDKKNPMKTTTYGTGQLILHAINSNCKKIILGIGGSATNDGGVGMAAALGVSFTDKEGRQIALNGEGLGKLYSIDHSGMDKRLSECEIVVACDVDNPLCGKDGASYIFGPQKGADSLMVKQLDDNLCHYAEILNKYNGISVKDIPGTGAAGGIAASLLAFTKCSLKSGISIVLDTVGFDDIIRDADLVITGEGKIDGQSLRGKVPAGIAARAAEVKRKPDVPFKTGNQESVSSVKQGIPVVAVVGDIGGDMEGIYKLGIKAVFSTVNRAVPFEEVKLTCREDLYKIIKNLIRFASIFD